jgi:hypothetical protein
MKTGLTLAFTIFLLTCSTFAFSDVTTPERERHSFAFGISTEFLTYRENGVTIDGPLYGVYGTYTYHGGNRLMAEASLALAYGDLDYDGRTWGGSPAHADTEDSFVEFRGLIGYDWRATERPVVTPFAGLGYRYWNDDIKGSGGYERETTYWYCPFGVQTTSPLSHNGQWGIIAEYDLLLGGTVQSHLSDADSGYNNPEVELKTGNGYGLRCSVWVATKIEEEFTLRVEPFLIYWNIDESDSAKLKLNGTPVGYIYEPSNDTTSYGLRLRMEF